MAFVLEALSWEICFPFYYFPFDHLPSLWTHSPAHISSPLAFMSNSFSISIYHSKLDCNPQSLSHSNWLLFASRITPQSKITKFAKT